MTPYPDEAVERAIALVRKMAEAAPRSPDAIEAADIVALLPVPVDPDLLLAREMAEFFWEPASYKIRIGAHDDKPGVQACLAAIKKGRELERASQ